MPRNAVIPRPARARPAGAALWAPRLDRGAALPLSRQLAAALRAAIAEGRLGAGARVGYIDEVMLCMGAGGVSRTRLVQALQETRCVQALHPEIGRTRAALYYWWSRAKLLVQAPRRFTTRLTGWKAPAG